jgi:parvulin-like peptidyl-prolyl isomerase
VIESIGQRAERMAYRNRSEMKYFSLIPKIVLVIFLLIEATVFAADQRLPVINGKKTVATINGEPITLEEFDQELKSIPNKTKEKKNDLLRRTINARLMVQEARKIGLDELPEIRNMVDVFSKVTLRELLIEKQLKNVKADEKEVDRLYKESVKEWRINSVMFEKEDGAKQMEAEIKAGRPFEEEAKRVIAEGGAKGGEEKNFLGRKDLLPQIAEALFNMELGSISPIIPIQSGFVILKLEDIRYPENRDAKERARQQVLARKKAEGLKEYNNSLIKKYVKIHQEVLDGIDYESNEPGVQELLKDKRVVAEIVGESPITVGELTEYLKQQLYHGMDMARESKNLNSKKNPTLDEMLFKRVFRKEALRLGINKTDTYKNKIKEYEMSVVFGAFIQKAVAPDVKLQEEELKAYYEKHIKEFTFPEMMKINSLIFAKRENAEEAIDKLRKGTELQWLRANAEGQVDKNSAKDLLELDGNVLTTKDFPEGVRKIITGAKPGDFRLYTSPEGHFYVFLIQDVVPAKPQTYAEAREAIAKIIYNEKLNRKVEDWVDKLRAVSDVKVYLTN